MYSGLGQGMPETCGENERPSEPTEYSKSLESWGGMRLFWWKVVVGGKLGKEKRAKKFWEAGRRTQGPLGVI